MLCIEGERCKIFFFLDSKQTHTYTIQSVETWRRCPLMKLINHVGMYHTQMCHNHFCIEHTEIEEESVERETIMFMKRGCKRPPFSLTHASGCQQTNKILCRIRKLKSAVYSTPNVVNTLAAQYTVYS